MKNSRRIFLRNTTITALGSGLLAATPMEVLALLRKGRPSAIINVVLIGCTNQRWNTLERTLQIPQEHCTAICDIDQNILQQRKADLQKLNNQPALFTDYRKLLEQKNVDVVIIATPDHWHCLQMVDACAAGKDILMEKPVSNTIGEAQIMVAAAQRYNRVIQV